jgi:hypothetical protein
LLVPLGWFFMHAIRLRGPWELSIAGTNVAGRIDFPCTWRELVSAVASAGRELADRDCVTLLRRFHWPTGLASGDRVLLLLVHSGRELTARLNSTELALVARSDESLDAHITGELSDHNELAVDLVLPSPALLDSTAPVLEAILEIHSAS